jgi:hypothetical protein
MVGYLYGGNTGVKTAAELQREREIVDALIARGQRPPQNLGEGLSTLGQAIASRMRRNRLEKDEGLAKEAGSGMLADLFGPAPDSPTITPQSEIETGPLNGGMSTYNPEPSLAATPYPTFGPETPPGPEDWQQGETMPAPEPMATPMPTGQSLFPKTDKTIADMDVGQLTQFMSDPVFEHTPKYVQELVMDTYKRKTETPKPTSDIINYEYGLNNPGFKQTLDDGAEYGLQPIVTQEGPNDPNPGKYHLYQAGKAGQPPKEIELPFGWTPKMQFLNQETQFAPVATQGTLPPGQGPAPVPINNAQSAADTKAGAAVGDARADYASMSSKMPGLESVVKQLDDLSEKATYTLAGQALNMGRTQLGMDPSEGQVARTQYQSIVANQILPLLRDTFGAQFTAREGDTLMATLGDPDKTPQEKQAVLKSFIEQKRRDVEAKAVQGGMAPAVPPAAAPSAVIRYDSQGNRIP